MYRRVPRAYIISPELKPSVPQRGGSKIFYFTLKVLNLLRKFRRAAELKVLVLVLWHAASNEGRKKRTVGCAARRKLFTNINSSKYTINSLTKLVDRPA